jgi:hypothetical protein
MNNQTIVCCVVALLLGMLLANMLKNVCGCKLVEGQQCRNAVPREGEDPQASCLMQGGTWHQPNAALEAAAAAYGSTHTQDEVVALSQALVQKARGGGPCAGVGMLHPACNVCVQQRPEAHGDSQDLNAAYIACGGDL